MQTCNERSTITLLLTIVCLIQTVTIQAQRFNKFEHETTWTRVGIRTGIWVPVGRLARKFYSCPSYEFVIGPRGADASFHNLNVYASFTLPRGEAFNFTSDATTISTRSNLIFMSGLRWREEERLSRSQYFDFYTVYWGLGWATYFVDYKDPEGHRKSFGNVHWHLGWTLSKRVFGNQFIGITAQHNLIPHRGMRENVGRRFGNTSVNFGIEYRF